MIICTNTLGYNFPFSVYRKITESLTADDVRFNTVLIKLGYICKKGKEGNHEPIWERQRSKFADENHPDDSSDHFCWTGCRECCRFCHHWNVQHFTCPLGSGPDSPCLPDLDSGLPGIPGTKCPAIGALLLRNRRALIVCTLCRRCHQNHQMDWPEGSQPDPASVWISIRKCKEENEYERV